MIRKSGLSYDGLRPQNSYTTCLHPNAPYIPICVCLINDNSLLKSIAHIRELFDDADSDILVRFGGTISQGYCFPDHPPIKICWSSHPIMNGPAFSVPILPSFWILRIDLDRDLGDAEQYFSSFRPSP